MQSRMHPQYYLSKDIFDREREKIFRRLWLFAGLTAMAPEDGDSIQRNIAGFRVKIYNENGRYRAHDGQKNIALEVVGGLLMINFSDQPLPFSDQVLPAFHDYLKDGTEAFGNQFATTRWRCRFNWKLVFENLRDPLHVRFLHGKTFGNYVNFHYGVSEPLFNRTKEDWKQISVEAMRQELRPFSRGGAIGEIPERRRVPWHDRVYRYGGEKDSYFDWMVYPNLHISSGNSGHSFCIEHYIPLSSDESELELIWIMSRKKQNFEGAHLALLAQMHGSKDILKEDIDMLEGIQSGLHRQAPMPNQGAYEAENHLIERWYVSLLEADIKI